MSIKRLCDICGKECPMDEQLSLYFGPPTSTRSMAAKVGTKIVLMNDICKDCYDWLTKELKCRRELYENAEN